MMKKDKASLALCLVWNLKNIKNKKIRKKEKTKMKLLINKLTYLKKIKDQIIEYKFNQTQ